MVQVSENATITVTPATQARWAETMRVLTAAMKEFVRVLQEAWASLAETVEELFKVLRGTQQFSYPGVPQGFARRGTLRGLPQIPRQHR